MSNVYNRFPLKKCFDFNCVFCNKKIEYIRMVFVVYNKQEMTEDVISFEVKEGFFKSDSSLYVYGHNKNYGIHLNPNTLRVKSIDVKNTSSDNIPSIMKYQFFIVDEVEMICNDCVMDHCRYIISNDEKRMYIRLMDFPIVDGRVVHYSENDTGKHVKICDHEKTDSCMSNSSYPIDIKSMVDIFQDETKIKNFLML